MLSHCHLHNIPSTSFTEIEIDFKNPLKMKLFRRIFYDIDSTSLIDVVSMQISNISSTSGYRH